MFICLFSNSVYSQADLGICYEQPSVGVVVGYSGFANPRLEIGVGYQPWPVEGHFVNYPFAGFLALYEKDLNNKNYGVSVNAWYLAGFFSCGLGINRYTDKVSETYGIKPMIGMSFRRIGFMYGYNIFLNPNEIQNYRHSGITIKYYYPLWKKKKK